MKPNDSRGFVHRRIGRAIIGGITGGPGGAIAGGLAPVSRGRAPRSFTPAQLSGTRVHAGHGHSAATGGHEWMTPALVAQAGVIPGMQTNLVPGGSGSCPGIGSVMIGGRCVNLGDLGPGGAPAITPLVGGGGGEAVLGRHGAAMAPMMVSSTRSDCSFGGTVRGLILGNDGLCYNKGDITNKERMWPKGRAPLLTGGEMRCISKAAAAAGKLERTTKRLQKIGLMKRPKKAMTITQAKRLLHHAS